MVWLDAARVLAIFAVVLLHAAAAVVTQATHGSPAWWYGNVYDALVRWCVPVFVMISGALLLRDGKNEPVAVFYRKRVARIAVPLAAWTLLFLAWTAFKARRNGAAFDWEQALRSTLAGTPYYHLWFLYMIVGLYLFTPFVRLLVAGARRDQLWLLTALMFGLAALHPLLGETGGDAFVYWFLSYLPYFLCGYLMATGQQGGEALALEVYLMAAALTVFGCYAAGLYFYDYLSVTVIPMSLAVFALLKSSGWRRPGALAPYVLGVYLVHPVFLELFGYFVFKPETRFPLLSIPLTAVLAFVLSLATSVALSRIPLLKRIV